MNKKEEIIFVHNRIKTKKKRKDINLIIIIIELIINFFLFHFNVLSFPWFRKAEDGSAYFGSRTRMAQPILKFVIVEVTKPNIGNVDCFVNLFL